MLTFRSVVNPSSLSTRSRPPIYPSREELYAEGAFYERRKSTMTRHWGGTAAVLGLQKSLTRTFPCHVYGFTTTLGYPVAARVRPITDDRVVKQAARSRRAKNLCSGRPQTTPVTIRDFCRGTLPASRRDAPVYPAVALSAYTNIYPFHSLISRQQLVDGFHRLPSLPRFSHLHENSGSLHMVDVSSKCNTLRVAVAEAKVFVSAEVCNMLKVYEEEVPAKVSLCPKQEAIASKKVLEPHPGKTKAVLGCRSIFRQSPKGDIFGISKLAGIMAAKQTSSLIPLCHNLPLLSVEVCLSLCERAIKEQTMKKFAPDASVGAENFSSLTSEPESARRGTVPYVLIRSKVKTRAATGVEMEALTAVTVAGLTVYDMCKSVDKNITLADVRLVYKSGGKK